MITEYKNPSFKYGRMAGGIMGIGTLANKMGNRIMFLPDNKKLSYMAISQLKYMCIKYGFCEIVIIEKRKNAKSSFSLFFIIFC